MPAIAAAVEAYATVGEISDALRRVFGEYTESVVYDQACAGFCTMLVARVLSNSKARISSLCNAIDTSSVHLAG